MRIGIKNTETNDFSEQKKITHYNSYLQRSRIILFILLLLYFIQKRT